MTVAENVAYGLAARGSPRAKTRARVEEMLALVQLAHCARYPNSCPAGSSSAWRWRARSPSAAILLLDEPFAALDKNLRLDMQIEIKRIQRLSGTTTLIVTHDQEEALSMADRVAVFNQGRLEQFGTPDERLRQAGLAVRQLVRRHRQPAAGQARRAATTRAPTSSSTSA